MSSDECKTVEVHSCFRQDDGGLCVDRCRCRLKVTPAQAREWVENGAALWRELGDGVLSTGEIVRHAPRMMVPRAATIDNKHIERAYIYDVRSERERIEEYGLLTLLTRIELLAPFQEGPPGPVLTMWSAGGLSSHGRDNKRSEEDDEESCDAILV